MHKAILPAFAGLLAPPVVLARFAELGDHGEDWCGQLLGYLRAELKLGRLAADAQVDAAAAMIVGVCHEVVLSALLPPGAASGTPAIESVVTAVLGGIA
jgi:hypothetical protein